MSEFTKGKWQIVHGTDEFYIISGDALLNNCICSLFGYPTSRWDEQKANARLIAAAPEMYELLMDYNADPAEQVAWLIRRHNLLARIDGKEKE